MSETEVKTVSPPSADFATLNDERAAKSYSEEQFKGLLADKQAEVKKRQTIEAELAELKARSTGSGQAGNPTARDKAGNFDDAPMTVGQFRSMMAEFNQSQADARFKSLEAETTETARAKFTAETSGEGLDFDSVITAGESNLSEGDKLAIRQAKDPAAEKYRRCIFNTPELSEKAESVKTAKLLENIKLNGRVPGTGGVATTANASSVSEMSEEELNQLAESLD